MSEPLSFINAKTQSFESLKRSLNLTGTSKSKFDALNNHIVNTVVMGGELVIIGDVSTSSSTSAEAYLMNLASQIHAGLLSNNVDADDFFLENFEFFQDFLTHGSQGIGAFSDGWSKHMENIKTSLLDIESLHQKYLRSGSIVDHDKFYFERAMLFSRLEGHLDRLAAYGSGLRKKGEIKRLLEISTKSYLKTGEIAGYAEKVSKVAKAANLIKKGTYVGTALDVAATAIKIKKACSEGREEQCTRAKYVETSSFAVGLGGGVVGGAMGGAGATFGCVVVLGMSSGGIGALACGVVGGFAGGLAGGEVGGDAGEKIGDYLYGKSLQ
ncbi:hypothetical protein [Pseudomonas sp. LP_7_YM]|uniref:hypothetical protein n=1 Tax=Pseudomonas sp. LP_7_YM TaxID=2485137 RepID=UPI00105D41AB|nr:hypothetical protein [Pseudomonas sp. LP_7_YM]TDV67505.1 hypothetical protein EC915_10334 [Pseudomonas sp. LP_7_YM]